MYISVRMNASSALAIRVNVPHGCLFLAQVLARAEACQPFMCSGGHRGGLRCTADQVKQKLVKQERKKGLGDLSPVERPKGSQKDRLRDTGVFLGLGWVVLQVNCTQKEKEGWVVLQVNCTQKEKEGWFVLQVYCTQEKQRCKGYVVVYFLPVSPFPRDRAAKEEKGKERSVAHPLVVDARPSSWSQQAARQRAELTLRRQVGPCAGRERSCAPCSATHRRRREALNVVLAK